MLPESAYSIYGFLSPAEMTLLYRLASEVPNGGHIVEIGSFQGKSTVCLGLGAKRSDAWVWAIDPHNDEQVNETTHYGMENHAALLKNLVDFGVADRVRVIALLSDKVSEGWERDIDLLWIDGCHEYESVVRDLKWRYFLNTAHGRIAVHDSSGHFPDVSRALSEITQPGGWEICEQIDATTVLKLG